MELDVQKFEAAFGIKARNWKRELERRLKAGVVPQPGDRSLAAVGYPELFRVTIFLTDKGLKRWTRDHMLVLPRICCLCGAIASQDCHAVSVMVPHCERHGCERAGLLIETDSQSAKAVWITLTGMHEGFLLQTLAANRDGDAFPPWEAFPGHDSLSGFWKQAGQFWLTQVFLPFWNGLDPTERTAYLQKWAAPTDWQEWLERSLGG